MILDSLWGVYACLANLKQIIIVERRRNKVSEWDKFHKRILLKLIMYYNYMQYKYITK